MKGGVDGGQCHILVVGGVGRMAPIKAVCISCELEGDDKSC